MSASPLEAPLRGEPASPRGGAGSAGRAPPFPGGSAEPTPTLDFVIAGAEVLAHAAAPTLAFDLRIEAGDASIRSLSLNCNVRIAAPRRGYDDAEQARLFELFGAPKEWGRSLRGLSWAQTSFVVPAFEGETAASLEVACSYDFDVAANKYLHALRDGAIPLEFLFSGSVFYRGPGGALRTVRLPWDREASFDMPAGLWHAVMERYFPNSAWLRVRRDVFDRLIAFRSGRGLPTWDATLEALLPEEPADREGPA